MSRNNPVGNIPIKTPLLRKMVAAVDAIYLDMSADVKCIAEMFEYRVDKYTKRYLR